MNKSGVLTILFLFILFFIYPQQIKAQGTFSCEWKQQSNSLWGCSVKSTDCDPGYVVNTDRCSDVNDTLSLDSYINYMELCNDITNATCILVKESLKTSIISPTTCCLESIPNPWGAECPEQMEGIETALGCFPTHPLGVISWVLKYSIIFAGGGGFLLMLYGVVLIILSAGDPEKLKEGVNTFVSAVAGIMIIIFAVFILRLIGVTIFQLPGFS